MAKAASPLSIADLERILDEKRDHVAILLKKRDQLSREIERLDEEIQDAASLDRPIRRGARRRRLKNELPLRQVVLDILGKNKKGLPLAELASLVTESGYRSHSRNIRNVVYQCLYHTESIVLDKATGLYRVKK